MNIKYLGGLALACAAALTIMRATTAAQSPQSEKCQGSDCLRITAKRTGTRCGTSDSVEVSIQNVSSENLRGWVVFGTPSGKNSYSPTDLMRPGQIKGLGGAQYVCHGTGEVSVLANTGADPEYPPRSQTPPPTGDQQLGPSEFGSGGSGQDSGTLPSHHEESSLVPLSTGRLHQATNAADGVYELPIPEYDFYTSDAAACPAVMRYGVLTQRFALFTETGTARLTVKNHIFVQESDDVTSHFAGCLYPEQIKSTFHFYTHHSAASGDRG